MAVGFGVVGGLGGIAGTRAGVEGLDVGQMLVIVVVLRGVGDRALVEIFDGLEVP